MELNVVVKETTCLRPSEQSTTHPTTIELSGLDRISPALLYTVFFYKPQRTTDQDDDDDDDDDDAVEKAKEALRKVLVSWYPVAGRLSINESTGKLEIACNNEGVTMAYAVCDSKLEDLGRLHEYKPFYDRLVLQLPQAPDDDDISRNPLLVVQV